MIKLIFLHIVSFFFSILLSLKYINYFSLSFKEYLRYFSKSANLSLCYVAFSKCNSLSESIEAGRAGFLCCSYDIVTDWRNFDQSFYEKYEELLNKNVNERLTEIALSLYEKEEKNILNQHGLERGIIAFRIITMMLGSYTHYKKVCDFNKVGMLLQIGDDVLDFENDLIRNEMNCLNSAKGRYYLELFLNEFSEKEIKRLFPNGLVFYQVIKRTLKKARNLLNTDLVK